MKKKFFKDDVPVVYQERIAGSLTLCFKTSVLLGEITSEFFEYFFCFSMFLKDNPKIAIRTIMQSGVPVPEQLRQIELVFRGYELI